MIPSALVVLDKFPLTHNGKLDKGILLDPNFKSFDDSYVAPVSDMEIKICGIWQELLGIERIGVTDDFFRIGGDSILSIQLSGRMRASGFACQVKDIFECKTVSNLAAFIASQSSTITFATEQGVLEGPLGLLPIQQWFFGQVDEGFISKTGHWNQSFLIKVPELDQTKLSLAVEQLVAYHDVLRIKYVQETSSKNSMPKQTYQSNIAIPELKTLDVSDHNQASLRDTLTEWQSDFDLENGPMFQIGYLHGYEDGSSRIYMAMHHLIIDGVSWRILTEDIKCLYSGDKLPSKGSSYRQWVDRIMGYADEYPEERLYWEQQFTGLPDSNYLAVTEEHIQRGFELDSKDTDLLLRTASKAYNTEINDLLLTALAYSLRDINHSNIQGITLEGHGRENIFADIDHSRTIGWFTSMFPVKLEVMDSLKESIQSVKEGLRQIPNKGVGFGSFATSVGSTYSHQDLVPISFNYLGQFELNSAGDWEVISGDSGTSTDAATKDHNLININGVVSNGKLSFSIASQLGIEITQQLSDSFKEHLLSVISHCVDQLEKEGSSFTSSDFTTNNEYSEIIKPYSPNYNKYIDDLIFIHPARSGSECYRDLAETLGEKYNCIGIDNYNIYHEQKIDSVNKIANYYLSRYEKKYDLKNTINLLGWSLGGLIALEIAMILESRGYENINLILLDAIVLDEKLSSLLGESRKIRNRMLRKNHSKIDVESLFSLLDVEERIEGSPMTGYLRKTNITLFKAMIGESEASKEINDYQSALKINNVDKVV